MDELAKFIAHLETLANDPAVEAKLKLFNAILEKIFAGTFRPPTGSG